MDANEFKGMPILVLAVVAVIGVAGLIILFNTSETGQVALKVGGQKAYGSAGLAYAGTSMNCETMTQYGRVPAGYDYEAAPSDAVNRFGLDKCFDARDTIGYFCCNAEDLYGY
jgi:hypothetical protein